MRRQQQRWRRRHPRQQPQDTHTRLDSGGGDRKERRHNKLDKQNICVLKYENWTVCVGSMKYRLVYSFTRSSYCLLELFRFTKEFCLLGGFFLCFTSPLVMF